MIRRFGLLLVSGLLLTACGASIAAGSALHGWVVQSDFAYATTTLHTDARHAATALRDRRTTANQLHLVCGVLLFDTQSANASLPTPDEQTTQLLSRAYTELGAGAHQCYVAGPNLRQRAVALRSLESGAAALAEANARIASG